MMVLSGKQIERNANLKIRKFVVRRQKELYKTLNNLLRENNITQREIAEKLNINSLGTVSLKLNGKSIITLNEANGIKELLEEKTKKKYKLEELFKVGE